MDTVGRFNHRSTVSIIDDRGCSAMVYVINVEILHLCNMYKNKLLFSLLFPYSAAFCSFHDSCGGISR